MLGLDYDSSSDDEEQHQQQQQQQEAAAPRPTAAAATVRLPNAAELLAGGAPGPSGLSSLPPPDFGTGFGSGATKRDHPDTRGPRSTAYDGKVQRR